MYNFFFFYPLPVELVGSMEALVCLRPLVARVRFLSDALFSYREAHAASGSSSSI